MRYTDRPKFIRDSLKKSDAEVALNRRNNKQYVKRSKIFDINKHGDLVVTGKKSEGES